MFCYNCGNTLPQNSKFCPVCGTHIIGDNPQPTPAPQVVTPVIQQPIISDALQNDINKVQNAIEYFSVKQNIYDSYDVVCNNVINNFKNKTSFLLILGCAILATAIVSIVIADVSLTTLLFMPGVILTIIGAILTSKKRKNLNYYKSQYYVTATQLHYLCFYCKDCPVNPEFTNPRILNKLLALLKTGNYNSIDDALGFLVSIANRSEIDEYLSNIYMATTDINQRSNITAMFIPSKFL